MPVAYPGGRYSGWYVAKATPSAAAHYIVGSLYGDDPRFARLPHGLVVEVLVEAAPDHRRCKICERELAKETTDA